MNLQWTIEELRRRGLRTAKNGTKLSVKPADKITPQLRIAIRTWKPALWFLAEMDTPAKPPKADPSGQFTLSLEDTQ